MRRRDFLHHSSHALASTMLFKGLAASSVSLNPLLSLNPENDHVLVMIFLNGGNDGLNTVVPLHQYNVLSQLRPDVILPENKVIPLRGHDGLGLHPSLVNLNSLFNEDRLQIVRGVGYPDQNYSHFRSADIWMSGANADELIPSGVMGRYLDSQFPGYPDAYPNDIETDPLSIELGASNSLLFQGPLSSMSLAMHDPANFYQLIDDQIDEVPSSVFADKLRHVKLIRSQSQSYGRVVRDAGAKANNLVDYPENNWLAEQLKIVARLIAGGLRTPIYKVELDGFDTHADQVIAGDTTVGMHAYLLQQVDQAIMAFLNDLEALGVADRVLGMTFSEFGRRIISNASTGTDHGAAGPMFFFGNAVEGGILGKDYELDASMTDEDNLPFQYDFRQAYGTVLENWLCVQGSDLNAALIGNHESLPILKSSACGGTTSLNDLKSKTKPYITVSPNPIKTAGILQFESDGNPLQISLMHTNGQRISTLVKGTFPIGKQEFAWTPEKLSAGNYYLQIVSKNFRQAKLVQLIR